MLTALACDLMNGFRATGESPHIGLDQPLQLGTALKLDKLARQGFAESVVASLQKVTSAAGFVLSVEGTWGSGKTSTLAMIEELLLSKPENERPVIVRFNPWLVGERDALLRQFLAKLANSVKLAENAKEGKRVAKELKSYSKAFDVVKLIPGAEPWASIVKSIVESVSDATDSIAEYKTPDIELHKVNVEAALRKFPRSVIVIIDDIDRLFPHEVFEMVRIIKAVGDLPHVGYVLAWDPSYVSSALSSASVPQSDTYLDKIVQVRMPLPSLSMSAKETLINEAIEALHPDALKVYFRNDKDRLSILYFSGLRDLLEQPRDVNRVFYTVSVIEPALRGEVVFSDIVGLAALMVKAPAVFELLRKEPRWFVGRLPGEHGMIDKSEANLKAGTEARAQAYARCSMPSAVRQIVHYLFPQTAKTEGGFALDRIVDIDGHIGDPTRLFVALQLSVSPADVSLVLARKYLFHPEHRNEITQTLTTQNCLEFMESLGDLASSLEGNEIGDLDALCLSIARLADTDPCPTRARDRTGFFSLPIENVAVRAISELVKAVDKRRGPEIAASLIEDEQSLTVAVQLFLGSYLVDNSEREQLLVCSPDDKARLTRRFAKNALVAATKDRLLRTANPGFILWNLTRIDSSTCSKVFKAIKTVNPSLDGFALAFLKNSFDSNKGQIYALPRDKATLEAYCSPEVFCKHARERLADSSITLPVKAAWLAVAEGKPYYGKDGSIATR